MNILEFLRKEDRGILNFLLSGAIPADAIMLIGTMGIMLGTMITFATTTTNILVNEFIYVGFHNPKFFEDVRGIANYNDNVSYAEPTNNFLTFELMRETVFPMGALLIFAMVVIAAWGQATGLFKTDAKSMFMKFIAMLFIVLIFTYVWDFAAIEFEKFSMFMLNPMYKPYSDNECIDNPKGIMLEVKKSNKEIADRLAHDKFLPWHHECSPDLRFQYIYKKVESGVTHEVTQSGGVDIGADISAFFQNITQAFGTNMFLGLTKMMIMMIVTLTGVAMLVVREIMLSVVISLLPLFAILAFIPHLGKKFAEMMSFLLPLLMIPVIVAVVIFVGAGFLYDYEQEFVDRAQTKICTEDYWPAGCQEVGQRLAGSNINSDNYLSFWMTSVAVIAFAFAIPSMMVPMLQGVASTLTQAVGHAVSGATTSSAVMARAGGSAALGGLLSSKPGSSGKEVLRNMGAALGHVLPGAVMGSQIREGQNALAAGGINAGREFTSFDQQGTKKYLGMGGGSDDFDSGGGKGKGAGGEKPRGFAGTPGNEGAGATPQPSKWARFKGFFGRGGGYQGATPGEGDAPRQTGVQTRRDVNTGIGDHLRGGLHDETSGDPVHAGAGKLQRDKKGNIIKPVEDRGDVLPHQKFEAHGGKFGWTADWNTLPQQEGREQVLSPDGVPTGAKIGTRLDTSDLGIVGLKSEMNDIGSPISHGSTLPKSTPNPPQYQESGYTPGSARTATGFAGTEAGKGHAPMEQQEQDNIKP